MGLGENGRRVARLVEEVKRGGEEMGGDRRKAMFKAFTASGEDFFTHSPFRHPSLALSNTLVFLLNEYFIELNTAHICTF